MRIEFTSSFADPCRTKRQLMSAICALCTASFLGAMCAAAAEPAGKSLGQMYWTHRGQGIFRAARDGSDVTLVVEMKNVDGLAVDAKGGKLYFTVSSPSGSNTDKLLRANLDGTEVTELASGLIFTGDVVFDPRSKKLYVSSLAGHKVLQFNADGTEMHDFVTGLITPDELALDVEGRFLYWSHSGSGGPIQRAKLDDGSDLLDVVNSRVRRFGMAIAPGERQVYWVDVDRGDIVRTRLDGEGETRIVTGRMGLDGLALDPYNRKIYWTEAGKICQANLDGSGIEVLVPDKTEQYASLVILPPKE
jgi:sugar lactone lactonase YvrE